MSQQNEVVVLTCAWVRETAKAVLVKIGEKEYWFPKSQIVKQEGDGDECLLTVTQWIAEQKELKL